MARHFDGASYIRVGIGALGFTFGPGTVACVCRTNTDDAADRIMFQAGIANPTPRWVYYRVGLTSPATQWYNGVAGSVAINTITVADDWCLIAATKAAGTTVSRGHKYIYGNDSWAHADSSTTMADAGIPATSSIIGSGEAAPVALWSGDIEVIGVWNVVLTDGQLQTLPRDLSLANWQAAVGSSALKGMWALNQEVAAGVTDLTGNGGNQTAIVGTYPVEGPPISVVRSPVYSAFPPKIPMGG